MTTSTPADRPGETEFLANYQPGDFAPFSNTVDLAIFTIRDGDLCVLLIERGDHPYKGHWALPGGFVEADEDIEAAAWRELAEETGVDQFEGYLEQLRTYGTPGRDPRMRVVSIAHVAMAPNLPDPQAGSDASAARWWRVHDLILDPAADPGNDAPALAFDHAQIITDALDRVRSKLEYTTLATRFVDQPFSIAELRRVYAIVWGEQPTTDLSNFRRKVFKTPGFVKPTDEFDESSSPTGGRPARQYVAGDATELQPPLLRPSREKV